jgi:tetratricopeptide (TPR) repeat protein
MIALFRRGILGSIPLTPLLLLSLATSASACLWYYGTNMRGESIEVSAFGPEAYLRHLTDDSEHRRLRNTPPEAEPSADADFKRRSDYAATLVHRGEVKRAIEILEYIERVHPAEYVVAANLGTAYELSGNNEKALRWVSEGIRRNKESHWGTEWLHVRILEAKLAFAKDPLWLTSHSVLGLDFGKDLVPSRPPKGTDGEEGTKTETALEYQLRERMAFVKSPDPIVGDLLSDLGNLLALNKTIEHAVAVYGLAIQYKPEQTLLVTQRRDHLQQVVDDSRRRRWLKQTIIYGGIVAAVVALLVLGTRSRRI